MHWGRAVVGRDLARHIFCRSRLGTRTYYSSQDAANFLPDQQQLQQLQTEGTLGPGQGQGQGRGRGRGAPLPTHFGTAGAPGQHFSDPFGGGAKGNSQQAAWTAPQWDGSGIRGDSRGQAAGSGWQAVGTGDGNSAANARVEPGAWSNGARPLGENLGSRQTAGVEAASPGYSQFSDSQNQPSPKNQTPGNWQNAVQHLGQQGNDFARSMASPLPVATPGFGYPQGTVPTGIVGQSFQGQAAGQSQVPGFVQTQGPVFGSPQGLQTSQSPQGFGHSQSPQGFGSSHVTGSSQGLGPSTGLSGLESAQNTQRFGPSAGVSGFGSSQNPQGSGSAQFVQALGSAQGFGLPQVPQGFEPSQGVPRIGPSQGLSGIGPSQSPQGFVSSQVPPGFGSSHGFQGFGPSQGPQGLGSSQGLSGMGPAQVPQGLGSSQGLSGMGPAQVPQGFGSSQGLWGMGPSQVPQGFGSSQGLSGMGPSQSPQGFVSSQVPPGFASSHGLQGFGPSQVPQGLQSSQGLSGIGPSQSPQGQSSARSGQAVGSPQEFELPQVPQGFEPSQSLSRTGPSQGPLGIGPSQSPQGFVSSQVPPGFGSSHGLQGFGPSQVTQGVGSSQSPQGFSPMQVPLGFNPSQVPQVYGHSQISQVYGPSQVPQGFGPSQVPQGFGHLQVPQGFAVSQGLQGFGPSQGLGPSQVPQGFVPSQVLMHSQGPQGFVSSQGPQGFVPSQGPQGFVPSQGPQGFVPSQGPQGFVPSQGPQGFVTSQGPQYYLSSQIPLGFAPSQGSGYAHPQGAGFQPVQGLGFGAYQGQSFGPPQGQSIWPSQGPSAGPPQGQSFTHAQMQGQFQVPQLSQVPQQQPWNISDPSLMRKPESNVSSYFGQAAPQAEQSYSTKLMTGPSRSHEPPGTLQQARPSSPLPLPPSSEGTAGAGYGVSGGGKVWPTADSRGKDYALLIDANFRQGRLNEVEVLFEEMKQAQIPVQIPTYNVLMEMYSRSGQLDKLDQVFKDMRQVAAGFRQSIAEPAVPRSSHPSPLAPSASYEQPSVSPSMKQDIFSQAPHSLSSPDSSPNLSHNARAVIPGPIFSDSVKPAESGPQLPQSSTPSVWTSHVSMPAVEPKVSQPFPWKSQAQAPLTKPAFQIPVVEPIQSSPSETPKRSDWSPQVSVGRPLSPLPVVNPIMPQVSPRAPEVLSTSPQAIAPQEPVVTIGDAVRPAFQIPVVEPIQSSSSETPKRSDWSPQVSVGRPLSPLPTVNPIMPQVSPRAPEVRPTSPQAVAPQEPVVTIGDAVKPESIPELPHRKGPERELPLQFLGLSISPRSGSGRGQVMSQLVSPDKAKTSGLSRGQVLPEISSDKPELGKGQAGPKAPEVLRTPPQAVAPQDPVMTMSDAVKPDSIPELSHPKGAERELPLQFQELSLSPRSGSGRGQVTSQLVSPDEPAVSRGQVLPEISNDKPVLHRGQEASIQPGAAVVEPFVPLSLFGQRPEVRPGLGRGRGKPAEASPGLVQYPPRLQRIFSPEEAAERARALLLQGAERDKGLQPLPVPAFAPRMQLSPEEASRRAQAILLKSAERDIAREKEVERRKQALIKPLDDLSNDEAVRRAMSILEQNLRKPETVGNEEAEKRSKGKFDKFSEFADVTQRRRAVLPTAPTDKSTSSRIRSEKRFERSTSDTSFSPDSQPSLVRKTPEMELQDAEDAAKSALHQTFRMEFDPQYAMEDFGKNPDIEEKPLQTLEEALQEAKNLLMPLEGITEEDDWQARVKEMLDRAPHLDKLVEAYTGPPRMTARQQNEQLDVVAGQLPPHASPEITAFTQRALLTLQNNPSWRFTQKERMMKNVVSGFSNY